MLCGTGNLQQLVTQILCPRMLKSDRIRSSSMFVTSWMDERCYTQASSMMNFVRNDFVSSWDQVQLYFEIYLNTNMNNVGLTWRRAIIVCW